MTEHFIIRYWYQHQSSKKLRLTKKSPHSTTTFTWSYFLHCVSRSIQRSYYCVWLFFNSVTDLLWDPNTCSIALEKGPTLPFPSDEWFQFNVSAPFHDSVHDRHFQILGSAFIVRLQFSPWSTLSACSSFHMPRVCTSMGFFQYCA